MTANVFFLLWLRNFHFLPSLRQLCVIPMQVNGDGKPQVAEEHLVVSSNDLSLPVFQFHPVRCFYNASRPEVSRRDQCTNHAADFHCVLCAFSFFLSRKKKKIQLTMVFSSL